MNTVIFPHLIQIWQTRRRPFLGAQQHVAIQERTMVVLLPVPLCAIATNTDIEGVATVKACNTREIQSNLARCAALAPHTPCFHDVVQCEDFPEIQQTVVVAVQTMVKVGVCPIVAVLHEKLLELLVVDSTISIQIHGIEEVPRFILKIPVTIVIISMSGHA